MILEKGDNLILILGASRIEAALIEVSEDKIVVATPERLPLGIELSKVELYAPQADLPGTAELARIHKTPQRTLLHLETVEWQGTTSRAPRQQFSLEVAADFESGQTLHHTIGRTIDLSVSGAKVRLPVQLPQGSRTKLVIRLRGDMAVEAEARVVRVSEPRDTDGYDIAFSFEKVLSGYGSLVRALEQGIDLGAPTSAESLPDDRDDYTQPKAA